MALRPLLVVVGLAAGAALIWFVGPLLEVGTTAPLASARARWVAIAALALVALSLWLARSRLAAQRNRALMEGLAVPARAAPGAAEVAVIGKRFEQAIDLLKRSRIGGKRSFWSTVAGRPYVYELPWYVIIGAPGAGKTTALVNSGLEFPLASNLGQQAVRGVGGTRNCDWWFTTDAVLIDTAGRYTTQDSHRDADRAAWSGFLGLLARYRPRQPINGVLLTISVSDLLNASADKRLAHARELRARIEELHQQLGIRFPVYVLVTKTDLLAGFMEFFADFDKDERAQVWGVTFALDKADPGPLARMASELAALEKRLNECLIDRLRGERDRDRRAAIYAFPQQWRVLRETLFEFLQATFDAADGDARPLVRGVYFTSATQEGTPMDRALGGLARALGLANRVIAPARPSGKSFFVTRLLRDIVIAEAALAGTNRRWANRRAWLEWGAIGGTVAAVLLASALAWQTYVDNQAHVAGVGNGLAGIERQVAAAKAANPDDLVALLPVLDSIAALTASTPPDAAARALRLDQRTPLAAAARDAYQQLLKEAFLPRIATRLEARLNEGGDENVETIYEALKTYLMLFGGRNFDRNALHSYLLADWDARLPASVTAAQHASLRRHLDALLAGGEVGAPANADAALVDKVRGIVARVPLLQRVYTRLKQLDAELPAFSVETAAGASAAKVFGRVSGRSLTQGVPGLYSHAVLGAPFRERTNDVLRQLAREASWVLGSTASAATPPALGPMVDEIERMYVADYVRLWDEFVRDLRLVTPPTVSASAELAQLLARPDSPLAALLNAIVREVSLDASATAGVRSARTIDSRFDDLHQFVVGQPTSLAHALGLIGKLSAHLTAVDDAVKRKTALPVSDVSRELGSASAQAPEPVRTMLSQLAVTTSSQLFAAVREPLARQLASEVGAVCARSVESRYPLARASADEASREEFAKTFASGGLIDGFFQRHLAPFVDTSGRSWTFRAADGGDTLVPFQRAQSIRETFFRDGGRTLGVRLELRLLEMDPGISQFTIDVDGNVLRFARDTRVAQTLQWPGPSGAGRVHVQVAKAGGSSGPGYVFEGPWALLRLLDRVRTEPGASSDRMLLTFDVEGRKARFESRSLTPNHPLRVLQAEPYQCPKRL